MAGERRHGCGEEEVRAETRLQSRPRVDAAHDIGVDADPGTERVEAALDLAEVDPPRSEVVGERQQVLGGVDDLAGNAEQLAEDIR